MRIGLSTATRTLQDRRRRGDLIQTYRIINGIDKVPFDSLFKLADSIDPTTRGHPLKLNKQHVKLNIRKHFFSQRVINDWNQLPCSTVKATTLLDFKIKLTNFLGYHGP